MDQIKQISAFVGVATKGSLTAAAQLEGVTPAMIGRRIDALEARLGVKLLVRTTRRVSLTFEGAAFLEDCQRVLDDLANAEASVSLGGVKASGHIRVSAPAGFGRRHVAPLVMSYQAAHPEVSVSLSLTDRLVDLVNESIDCAVRVGELRDSSLVSVKLAEMARVVVASPDYLANHGRPETLEDLAQHDCLSLTQQQGWSFRREGDSVQIKVSGTFECNDGAVLTSWAKAGRGLVWRSVWEVGGDIAAGRLVSVLDEFSAPPVGVYAVFPQRRHLALRVRLLIDFLKNHYGDASYWQKCRAG